MCAYTLREARTSKTTHFSNKLAVVVVLFFLFSKTIINYCFGYAGYCAVDITDVQVETNGVFGTIKITITESPNVRVGLFIVVNKNLIKIKVRL